MTDELPDTWAYARVSDVGHCALGQQRSPESVVASKAQYPYLRVANVQDNSIDFTDLAYMSFDSRARSTKRLQPSDILLCEGQSRELVGRAALFDGEFDELYFQNTLIRFRSYFDILPRYALLVFRAYQHTSVFSEVARGTTNIFHLGLRRFKNILFPLPPRDLQQTLVDVGRALQDTIDFVRLRATDLKEQAEGLSASFRDYYIMAAVDRAMPSDIQKSSSKGPWQRVEDMVAPGSPITYGIVQPGPDVPQGSGIPYVRGQDLQDGHILVDQLQHTDPSIASRYERSRLQAGDVLLSIVRHPRVAVVPPELDGASITQGTARLRPGPKIDGGYLRHWLASASAQSWLRSRMRGISMPGLNLRDVRKLPVPVVDLAQQRHLARVLDDLTANCDTLLIATNRVLDHADKLENEVLHSVAYGDIAESLGKQAYGAAELHAASVALKQQILEAVREDASLPPLERTNEAPMKAAPVVRPDEREYVPIEQRVQNVLHEAARPLKPEELFEELGLGDESIDTYFSALRSLVGTSTIDVVRPDDTQVYIEIRPGR